MGYREKTKIPKHIALFDQIRELNFFNRQSKYKLGKTWIGARKFQFVYCTMDLFCCLVCTDRKIKGI